MVWSYPGSNHIKFHFILADNNVKKEERGGGGGAQGGTHTQISCSRKIKLLYVRKKSGMSHWGKAHIFFMYI